MSRLLATAGGIGALVLGGCAAKPGKNIDLEGVEAGMQRWQQRLNADGTMPANAIMTAKLQRDAMARRPSAGADTTWTWVGPGNIGGRLRGILIHPQEPNIIWVGAATGGIWKSTNGGSSFAPLNDFVPSLTIGCMALDPTDPDVLYAGTGEGFFNTPPGTSNTAAPVGAGIFRSGDGGQTWRQLAATATADWRFVNRIAIQPGNSQVLVAATESGIWRSDDGGETWSRRTTTRTLQVLFHPTDPSRMLAGRNDGIAQYSTDAGLTWQNATGISGTRVELAYAPGAPDTVYAAVSTGSSIRLYRSSDGGISYAQRPAPTISTLSSYTGVIWVDPLNPNHILYGGQAMYRSVDGGATRTAAYSSVHADHHIIAPHPGYNGSTNKILYFGNDGGIYRTTDSASNTSAALNNNLGVTQFYGGAINDATGVIVAGAQDNFTLRYPGTGTSWTQMYGGDGTYACSDPTNSNIFYGGSQRLNIQRSTNGGISSSASIAAGISDGGTLNCNFIAYFMLDPSEPQRMLACGRRLWRTVNARTGTPPSWTVIKPTIEPPPLTGSSPGSRLPTDHFEPNSPWNISTVAIASNDSNVVWVGYNNGQVWRSIDGTALTPTWTRVDENTPLPDRWVSRIVIDPADHQRVYVSFMGFAPDNIWRTADAGATWTNISGSGAGAMPSIPVGALARHPQRGGFLIAGTDIGLFTSTDDGGSWAPDDGVGLAEVAELVWRNSSTILAVTHGRGAYLGQIPAPCYANCDESTASPVLNVADFTCFLQRFAANDAYANCDDSSAAPTLNVADFTCFLQRYAAGCP